LGRIRDSSLLVLFSVIATLLTFAAAADPPRALAPAAASPDPDAEQAAGKVAFRNGDFALAAKRLGAAAAGYGMAGRGSEQIDALLQLAEAQEALGEYHEAVASLELARKVVEPSGDRARIAGVLGALGNARIAVGPDTQARNELEQALALAKAADATALAAGIANNLGNAQSFNDDFDHALESYGESVALAEKAGDPLLQARALANTGRAWLQTQTPQKAKTALDAGAGLAHRLPDSHQKSYVLINLGRSYQRLSNAPDNHAKAADTLLARKMLSEAADVAERTGDTLAESYAYGYLGGLYEDHGKLDEALGLTRRALFAAQTANAPESLYLWEWQSGRILKAQGKLEEAIESYRSAVRLLQSLRHEMASGYGPGHSSFREAVGPVYFQLVDLLLQRSASASSPEHNVEFLGEARDTVELLKAAELRDYFRDECVDALLAKTRSLDKVSDRSAVIYPILFPDRVDTLVTLPSGLQRFTVPVGAAALTSEVREFRRFLEKRTTSEYLPHAQKLYNWLIRPLESALVASGIDTLVFVPDGPLRTIPMSSLHDGQAFLIEKYAVAMTPGLSLTDPRPLDRGKLKLLLGGLAESVQGFPALPQVRSELTSIQRLYGGDLLLDGDFVLPRVEGALSDQQLNIVHIASHGEFKGDRDKSFLLTHDGRLTMDQLGDYVGLFRFRETPLELLTLSACETAAGDDRAALGLAGVAIKAGARSALGTLWPVSDQAAAILVVDFYKQLEEPTVSRAHALQRAQQELLADARYAHPGYWSAFLLISNWL